MSEEDFTIEPATGNYLNNITKLNPIVRMVWMDKPDILKWKFRYAPTYGISGCLLYNYEETDASFRIRVKQTINSKK